MTKQKTEKELRDGGRSIKKALDNARSGKWKITRLMKAINKNGKDCINLITFSPADVKYLNSVESNLVERGYTEGDNSDREKFGRSPYHDPLGKFFQVNIKNIIRHAIETAEWWIVHKYDKDAFVYDSEWLKRIDTFTDDFIECRFQHAAYKLEIMHRIRHIVFFMAKEDRFYGPVLKDFINKFVVEFKDGFSITENEQYGLDVFNTGTTEEIQARITAERKADTWLKHDK